MINDFEVSKDFRLREFQCRHCGQVKLDPRLVNKLQALRDRLGVPLAITSGYRCPDHNKAVGGAPSSYHVKGQAADVVIPRDFAGEQLASIARELGFTGVGLYADQNFVHVDVRTGSFVRFR